MAAARSGALLSSEMDSFAIYPDEKFKYYMDKHPRLKMGQRFFLYNWNMKNKIMIQLTKEPK